MKCTECKDYKECHKKYDLRRKRVKCSKAKGIYVPTNADRIRQPADHFRDPTKMMGGADHEL